jgi:hypothetical protein
MNEPLFLFYVGLSVFYVIGFIALATYASNLHKSLKLIEQEAERIRLLERLAKSRPNPSTHKSDPTQPLLGVVLPKDQDFKDMLI